MNAELLQHAATEAARHMRTATNQLEYWAELGRALDGLVSQEDAICLRAGLLRLKPHQAETVDPSAVFADLEASRPTLPGRVTEARVVYQASARKPGYLEQIHPDGRTITGRYENGVFHPATD